MRLTFERATMERLDLPAPYDLIVGLVATFRMYSSGGALVYSEENFPIVELALALTEWQESARNISGNFEFNSIESDETGIVWIRESGDQQWRTGALEQERPDLTQYSTQVVEAAIGRFVGDVDNCLLRITGRSLSSIRNSS